MLHITFPQIIYFITGGLYLLTPFTHSAHPPTFSLFFSVSLSYPSAIFLNFLIFERETETEHEVGAGKRKRKSRIWSGLQAPNWQHRAQCRAWSHEQWDRDPSGSRMLNHLSHPGAPPSVISKVTVYFITWLKSLRILIFNYLLSV